MKQMRRGVFETNSSSTHSLTICTEEEFEKWRNGELLFDRWNDCFIEERPLSDQEKTDAMENYNDIKSTYWKNWEQLSEEEIESWYRRYASQYLNKSNDGQTYDEYMHSSYDLEVYSKHYTSPSGDELVVFGKYGYDG